MPIAHNPGGPCIELERSLPSEVAVISPFVDNLMLLVKKCGCVPKGESDVEIALREALANATIHGNHEIPRSHVYVRFRCKSHEVSIAVKDEVRFEEGGVVVHMRKSTGHATAKDAQNNPPE